MDNRSSVPSRQLLSGVCPQHLGERNCNSRFWVVSCFKVQTPEIIPRVYPRWQIQAFEFWLVATLRFVSSLVPDF